MFTGGGGGDTYNIYTYPLHTFDLETLHLRINDPRGLYCEITL